MRQMLGLGLRLGATAKLKFFLLVVFVAVGMTVFLLVIELSRVSSIGLEDAIAEDAGETGTYDLELATSYGESLDRLVERVLVALAPWTIRAPVMIEVMPPVLAECPPFESLGEQPILILHDVPGDATTLPFGEGLPGDTRFCFDGQEIPRDALYLPSEAEQRRWGSGLFVDDAYRDVVALSSTQPITYRFSFVTGRREDLATQLNTAVEQALQPLADRGGLVEGRQRFFVRRVDDSATIRSASEGVRLVYAVIAWGVLILGGLGLLVAEVIVVRDRMWFFGLARAVGARGRHIVGLIVVDVLLVLTAGTALSLILAVAVQPAAQAFARDAFGIDVRLLQASTVPSLVVGVVLVLVLAAAYPAAVATRQDPLDVLEAKAR